MLASGSSWRGQFQIEENGELARAAVLGQHDVARHAHAQDVQREAGAQVPTIALLGLASQQSVRERRRATVLNSWRPTPVAVARSNM